MARILILEPHPELRELFSLVTRRLGHEPVVPNGRPPEEYTDLDVVLVEPAGQRGLAVAELLRERSPETRVVCASVLPASEAAGALDPVAYLVKPFSLAELEQALTAAAGAGA